MKILITDKVHGSLLDSLRSKGWKIDYRTDILPEEVWSIVDQYKGIIINSKINMDRDLIERGRHLEFIARLGSGMEIIDIPYAREKGIRVINTPEGNCNAVAEHAVGMLLVLANRLCKAHREVSRFIWNREGNRGFELEGKTVGIIGVGHTGSAMAGKLQNWGVRLLGYDKYKEDYVSPNGIIETGLEEVMAESDIISFHLPLSKETMGMCDLKFLHSCKPGVIILNTSRGQVVNTKDLIFCLESGQVGGACLDVFENEKPSTYTDEEKVMYSRLYSFSNAVLSPHVAGWTQESLRKIADLVFERICNDYSIEELPWQ